MKQLTLMLLLAAGMSAAPIITLDQPNVGALPGGVASWTFRMQADPTLYTSVTTSFLLFETEPGLGIYTDEIGLQGGPGGRLAPAASDWLGTVGFYLIDPAAIPGDRNDATLRLTYDLFNADPANCTGCYVGSGESDFTVRVNTFGPEAPVEGVPEPSTYALCSLALSLGWYLRKRS